MLALYEMSKAKLTWYTSLISPAKRLRIFFQNNTVYEGLDAQVPPVADLEWTQDWSPLVRFERSTLREVPLQPFMRPIAVLSDLALRYSWSSYYPSALLWRISHWHTKEGLAIMATSPPTMEYPTFSGMPSFHRFIVLPGGISLSALLLGHPTQRKTLPSEMSFRSFTTVVYICPSDC